MDEKLVRQIFLVVIGIIALLAIINILQTLVSMIVPLAVIAIGGFAFYKIVIEGRDEQPAMQDEVAETSGMIVESSAETVIPAEEIVEEITGQATPEPEETQAQAEERLSAVDQAKRDYVDSVTPAEEILENIKSRKQRLQGDEE